MANKRIEFNREKLIDHYATRNTLPDFIYGIIRLIGIVVQNIYCVSSYLVLSWIILLPLGWIKNELYSKAENFLYNSLLFIVSSWSLAAGMTVVETGEEFKHLIEDPNNSDSLECNKNKHDDTVSTKRPTNGQINSTNLKANNIDEKFTSNLRLENSQTLKDETTRINTTTTTTTTTNNNLKPSNKNSQATYQCGGGGDQLLTIEKSENDLIRTNDSLDALDYAKINHNNNDSNFAKKLKNNTTNCVNDSNKSRTTSHHNAYNNNQLTRNNNIIQKSPSLYLNSSDIKKKPRVLLLCNHISTADVPLLMQSFSTLTNQSLLWVLDAQFKPTNFGLVCSSHGDFFIAKDSFKDGSLKDQALKFPDRNLYVLFPEGGFWRKRLEGSNRYALKNGLPMTNYVTHPRFGAFKDLIDPSVEITHIVDATLMYDDIRNPLSILDITLGSRKEPAIINYKVYKRSEINPTEEWLRNIWLEKDKLLQQYYEDRNSVYKRFEGTMRSIRLDWFKLLAVHLFYLLVCYLTIYRLFSATSVTMLRARDLYYSNI